MVFGRKMSQLDIILHLQLCVFLSHADQIYLVLMLATTFFTFLVKKNAHKHTHTTHIFYSLKRTCWFVDTVCVHQLNQILSWFSTGKPHRFWVAVAILRTWGASMCGIGVQRRNPSGSAFVISAVEHLMFWCVLNPLRLLVVWTFLKT